MNRLIGSILLMLLMHSMPSAANILHTRDAQINALTPLVQDVVYTQTRTGMHKLASYFDYYQFTLDASTPLLKVFDISSNKVQTLVFSLYHWTSAADFKLSKVGQLSLVAQFTTDTDFNISDFSGSYVLRAFAFNPNNKSFNGGDYNFSLTAVPLPPAVILFGSVLFGMAVIGRRRNIGKRGDAA